MSEFFTERRFLTWDWKKMRADRTGPIDDVFRSRGIRCWLSRFRSEEGCHIEMYGFSDPRNANGENPDVEEITLYCDE